MNYLIARYNDLAEMKEVYHKFKEASAFFKDFPRTAAEQNTDESLYYVRAETIEEAINDIIGVDDYYVTRGMINLLILDTQGRLHQYNGRVKLRFDCAYKHRFKKGTFSPLLSFRDVKD